MKVLAIGCHPDDLEIACGGTLRKYVRILVFQRLVFWSKRPRALDIYGFHLPDILRMADRWFSTQMDFSPPHSLIWAKISVMR